MIKDKVALLSFVRNKLSISQCGLITPFFARPPSFSICWSDFHSFLGSIVTHSFKMHFVTPLCLALTAFTSTASAGTLHDRRRENLIQQMRRNKGLHNSVEAIDFFSNTTSVPNPAPSELSAPDSLIATTTALEGLNSTIGLNPSGVTETSKLHVTSNTPPFDTTTCPPALTITVTHTETSISTVEVCETRSGDENTSVATTNPAEVTAQPTFVTSEQPAARDTVSGGQLFSSTDIAIPPPTESAAIDEPILEQPTPLEDGAVTTHIITQTISSPAATLVSEFVTCRGRGRNQRCKVITVTEEQEESVGIETVTLVVTQSDGVNLVTRESGVADTPTATVVDGIATETAAPAPAESAPQGEQNGVETPVLITDGNAALKSSTSCADAGVTRTSVVTVDVSASTTVSEVASETTAPILTTQNPANENALSSEPSASSSASITISAGAPDTSENIVTESVISIITLTRSVVPIETTFGTGPMQVTTIVTPMPDIILSTITLGPGGITGTGTDAARPTGGAGNGKGKGKDQGKDKEDGKGNGNGGKDDEKTGERNDKSLGRNENNASGRGNGNGKVEYDIYD